MNGLRRSAASISIVAVLMTAAFVSACRRMGHSVWFDESQTHQIASQPSYAKIVEMARQIRPYPPLFFFIVHESLKLRPDETGLRIASAVFGALGLLAVFLLGREIGGEMAGLAAASFYWLTPGAFRYFVDANPYSLLALASTLATLFLFRATKTGRASDWMWYAVCALVGLATHTLFVFHVGGLTLAGVFLLRRRAAEWTGRRYRKLAVATAVLLAAAVLVALLVATGAESRPIQPAHMLQPATVMAMAGMYLGPLSFGYLAMLAIWCPLQALGATALFRKDGTRLVALSILIASCVVSITGFLISTVDYVAYRYAMGVFPLTCVVAGCALLVLPRGARLARAAVGAAMLIYCTAGGVSIVRAGTETFGYQDWRSAARYLTQHMKPGEAVAVAPDRGLLPLAYYYKTPGAVGVETEQIGSLMAKLLPEGKAPGATAWLALSTFENERAWIARFTQHHRWTAAEERRKLVNSLQQQGLAACEPAEFHRVTLFRVRRGLCAAGR